MADIDTQGNTGAAPLVGPQQKDQFGSPLGTPGFDPNSTARQAEQAAAEATVHAQLAGTAQTPAPIVARNSAADEWNATFLPGGKNYSLTPSQWNDLHPIYAVGRHRHGGLDDVVAAHDAASAYHGNTAEAIARTSETNKLQQSADFSRKVAALDHTDPDYSTKFADLVATHPEAGGPLVDQVLKDKQNTRETYVKALDKGGAGQYGSKANPTEEYNAYAKTFGETKDPAAAHTAAQQVIKNRDAVLKAKGEGLLTDADLPAWQPGWQFNGSSRPKVWNKDGTPNYQELLNTAANRQGQGQGLADQRKQETDDRQLFATLSNVLKDKSKNDPDYEAVVAQRDAALDRINAHGKKQAANNPPPPSQVSNLLPLPRKKK